MFLRCQLKNTGLAGFAGSGEGAGLITEQFGFHQSIRNGGTVDLQKWFTETFAGLIDLIGNDFLACTAFTGDQDGGICRSNRQAVETA